MPSTEEVDVEASIGPEPDANSSFFNSEAQLVIQANLDMTDSMGPGVLVRHMRNPSYTYDTYLICIGLEPSISSVIDKSPSYSGPSYPSLPVFVLSIHLRNLVTVNNLNTE